MTPPKKIVYNELGDIMKKLKYLLLIIPILFLTGCGEVAETDYTPNDGIIVRYTENKYEYSNLRKFQEDYYVIEVYSDRTIKFGPKNKDLQSKKLSVSAYNKIATLALSEEFYQEFFSDVEVEDVDPSEVDLTKDISTDEDKEEGGTDSYIFVYSAAGGVIGVGGQDPDNPTYNKLVKYLKKYAK